MFNNPKVTWCTTVVVLVRLPIGQDGLCPTVQCPAGVPNWEFLGQSVDVYYVAEHGTDNPSFTEKILTDPLKA